MATAEKISYYTGATSVQSPQVALRVVSSEKETQTPVVTQTGSSKLVFPSDPPRLQENNSSHYLGALWAFMMAMIIAQSNDAKNQSNVSGNQNSVADSLVKQSEDAQQKAVAAYKKYQEEVEAQQHQSIWQRILGGLGAAFGVLLAGLTGGLCTFMVAASIMILMTVPVDGDGNTAMGKLDTALANSGMSGLEIIMVKVGIIVGAAITLNAASAATEVGISTAVSTAKSVGEEVADELGTTVSENQSSFLSKVSDLGLNRGALASTAAQLTFVLNPVTDLVAQICQAANASDKTKKIVSEVMGAVFAIALAVAAGRIAGSGGNAEGLLSLKKTLSPNTFHYTYNTIDCARIGLSAGSATFGILGGLSGLDGANTLRELGKATAAQTMAQNMLSMTNDTVQKDQASFNTINDMFTMTSDTWQSYVDPYQLAAQILGSTKG